MKNIKNFIPKINNCGICDSFYNNLKFTKKNMKEVQEFIRPYSLSSKEFDIQFTVVMMLNFYIVDDYIDEVLHILNNISHEGQYVKMEVAQAISFAYIHYPNKTLNSLENNNLDKFTYNKALQKIIEPTRVSKSDKDLIRAMKIF